MRLTVREVPYDLYAIMVLSTLLVLSIVLIPGVTSVRVILGLPFILFFPGYVLISALYPERKLFYDHDGKRLPDAGPEKDDEGEYDDSEGSEADGGEGKVTGKGLDGLERLALSLGLSIAVTPLIGLVLNWTYDWDPEHLGIRLWLVLTSIFLFNVIGAGVAVYRRARVPLEDRFAMVLDISLPRDSPPMERLLTVGIVVMMVLSVSLLVYIIVVPRQGESFTEFYVLGHTGKADGYPSSFVLGEEQSIYIGIGNHEHRDKNYTIVLSIGPEARNQTVASLDSVHISKLERPVLEVRVKKGGTLKVPCNLTVNDIGHHKLRLLLFMDGREHRDLHIWVRVFKTGYLEVLQPSGIKAFLAGQEGDPARLGSGPTDSGPMIVSIGLTNPTADDLMVNITLHLEGPYKALPFPSPGPARISPGNGAYLEVRLSGGSTMLTSDLGLDLENGSWTIMIDVRVGGGTLHFSHPVVVGGLQ
ncbi:MAG: DUF1616 domain-containing protein [Candidatus Thermoplasmatota archaeon]|jgi:uncharacterized membrane protein|nr:DUF1616 domain-containing protein [Candidatus Thermoplasmatota archaeon]